MKLSIIVPVYNMGAEGKLNYCLDSLFNQTLPASEYEVIAVDDASTDNSPEILSQYAERYPERMQVIYGTVNKRQGGAKNEGLKHAKGEWIGFVDSDDWVSADCYEKLLRKAEETGADMVGCDYSLVQEHTMEVGTIIQNNSAEQTGVLDRDKHKKLLMRSGSMVIKIYKHQVIRENRLDFPEGMFYEDNCAGPVWSLYFKHFERVEEPLYYYYQRQTSTVHTVTVEKCRDRMKAAVLMYEQCRERGFLDSYHKEIEYRFAELYYVITLFSYMLGMKQPKLFFVKELRKGVERYFPEFRKNSYYLVNTNEEEKKMILLQQTSDVAFYVYYRLLWMWRRIRK